MSRYVDIEPLDVVGTKGVSKDYVEGMACAFNLLDNLPTADVEPVKHGHWIREHVETDGCFKIKWAKCSECGVFVIGKPNYCPDCGARMDGEEKNDEETSGYCL